MIVVYEEFADLYLATLRTAKVKGDARKLVKAQADVVEQMLDFSKRAMLWASPKFLLAYDGFRRAGQEQGPKTEVVLRVDDVLQSMRDDLGLSNTGLDRGGLVKMFLTDPENLEGSKGGSLQEPPPFKADCRAPCLRTVLANRLYR